MDVQRLVRSRRKGVKPVYMIGTLVLVVMAIALYYAFFSGGLDTVTGSFDKVISQVANADPSGS